jgi:hypothetical protein
MLQIDKTIVSTDLVTKEFTCNLERCKGACCVLGDSGAPLDEDEKIMLEQIYPCIKPFLRPAGVKAIGKQGTSVIDTENECVTPLIEGKECAYTIFEDGIARCGIEKAFLAGAIAFRKPISCFLYPVRVKKYRTFEAVNYDIWPICDPARALGTSLHMPVYEFTAPALRQRYGEAWYSMLQQSASDLRSEASATSETK